MVNSSVKTKNWLMLIVSAVSEQVPQLEYTESKYWGMFNNPTSHRNIMYIQPTRTQIRLHTRLPLIFDKDLQATSASKKWAKTCPTLFRVRSESDIRKAVELIVASHNFDLTLKENIPSK